MPSLRCFNKRLCLPDFRKIWNHIYKPIIVNSIKKINNVFLERISVINLACNSLHESHKFLFVMIPNPENLSQNLNIWIEIARHFIATDTARNRCRRLQN